MLSTQEVMSFNRKWCHNKVIAFWKWQFFSDTLKCVFSSPEPSGSQGELIVYPWSSERCLWSSSVVVPSHFKHLLRNCEADQSQILCRASLGRGNESLYKWSRSHDQDGHHALKLLKTLKKHLLQNHWANCLETWHVASGSVLLQNLYKSWPLVDLDLFYGKVNFGSMGIWMGKAEIFDFSVAIVFLSMEMKSSPSLLNARGQGHLVTLAKITNWKLW